MNEPIASDKIDRRMTFKNEGLYVEGRFFGRNHLQAETFAAILADRYNRAVEVLNVVLPKPIAPVTVAALVYPTEDQAAA